MKGFNIYGEENMRKTVKRVIWVVIVLFTAFACAGALFLISKSRNFQFFGEIVTNIPNEDKRIAITFDDGPTQNTTRILDKLKELDIKGTFFLCGGAMEENPEYVKLIASSGNAIGNHSFSHQRMVMKSYHFYRSEIGRTNELIRESGYTDTIFFRPPYGKKLFALPYYLNKLNMTTIMWDVEPETFLGFDAEAEEIADYTIKHVKSGSIILLHPMYNPDNVLPALDIIVKQLKEEGYIFDTIPELYRQYH